MIKLSHLLREQETFTATNKKTGNTSTFDSEEARDAAVKAGTHAKIKGKGDSKKSGKGGVNIFGKDAGTQKSLFPDIKPDSKPSDDAGKIKDPQGVAKVFPKGTGTNPAKVYNQLSKWMAGPDETGQHWEVDLSKLTPEEADAYEKLESDIWDSLWSLDPDNNSATPEDIKTAKARLKQIEKEGKYVELVYKGLEKKQNKPQKPKVKDFWNKSKTPAPKVGKFPHKPSKHTEEGLDLLGDMGIAGNKKLTPEDMGDAEYERTMLRMLFNSLEDANYHTANRYIMADLQGSPEKRKQADYSNSPDTGTPEWDEWSEKNTVYTKDFDRNFSREDEREDVFSKFSLETAAKSGWDGTQIVAAYLAKLRKDGKNELADRIQKSFEDAENSKNEGAIKLMNLLRK